MKLVVIDGQSGRTGALLVDRVRAAGLPLELLAVGTNANATAAMMKAGAQRGATGENPVLVACRDADIIAGPIGILMADALMGEITPDQIRFHEDRNRVLRALGADNAKPELSPTVMLTGGRDVFLLCTDGFWENVLESEMEQTLRASGTPEEWLSRMEALLRQRLTDDSDNYSAAAVFC